MGLIKAALTGIRSTLADQWLDYIYCDTLPDDVLMRKGQKRIGPGSSNTKGSDNIITKGSRIALNEGQFLLVVDDGRIVDFSDEPGDYTFDKSTEPSLFYGGFGKGLVDTFKTLGKRFTYGGDTAHDQRVYFVNKKFITDNKFGTKSPIPFRDSEWQITVNIRLYGTYVYKIVNPLLFYANLAGNVSYEYKVSEIEEQFKSDLSGSLLPALGKVSLQGIPYDQLPAAVDQLTAAIQEVLKTNWEDKVGINVDRVVIENAAPTDEDRQKIQKLQETRVFSNSSFATGAMRQAQASMISDMGKGMAKGNGGNGSGSDAMNNVIGMMGVQMMGNMMGTGNPLNVNNQQQNNPAAPGTPAGVAGWTCECGTVNSGKFCINCGKPKPDGEGKQAAAAPTNSDWICECGAKNTGKFCTECGKPKPVIKRYKCDKCGWVPSDPTNPPKFCPECGDIFNDDDAE